VNIDITLTTDKFMYFYQLKQSQEVRWTYVKVTQYGLFFSYTLNPIKGFKNPFFKLRHAKSD